MTGAERVGDVAVVLAALVCIADQQRDRRAGGLAFEHARQDLDLVFFLALRDMARRAGFAAVEFELDVGFAKRHTRRAAVDHAADSGAVRFAEGRDSEKRTERVAGHGRRPKKCGESTIMPAPWRLDCVARSFWPIGQGYACVADTRQIT